MTTASLPLAVTMGEPAGIGGELTLKAWLARQPATRPFFALDDPARLAAIARQLGIDVPVREIAAPGETASVFARALPVLSVKLRTAVRTGHPDPAMRQQRSSPSSGRWRSPGWARSRAS